ncbi:oxidoreductase [Salinibacter ruber]|uniref:oxidoreductase n=1 Tax=Salinibacter ruber TaxID=146919 RepID=UPI0020739C0B|nr:oxidoreductase [Salinibacter ruber]
MTVVVTGGCGLIGEAFVRALAERGDNVIAVDVDDETGEQLEDPEGRAISYRHCDVTDPKGFDRVLREARSRHGSVDAVVHAAYPRTSSWGTPFEELEEEDVAENLRLQLGSAIMVSQKAVKHFHEQDEGHLVHVSSIQGIEAPKFWHYEETDMTSPIEYSAIKSGVISITKYLAKYLSGTGIRVNCISPGGVKDGQPKQFIDKYRKSCTDNGMLSTSDLAGVLLFLLSDKSRYVNGQNLVIDDGWSL